VLRRVTRIYIESVSKDPDYLRMELQSALEGSDATRQFFENRWRPGGKPGLQHSGRKLAQEEKRTIPLPDPIPVYLLYQTACWVDEGGTLQFRNDIYGHDRRFATALCSEIAPERRDTYAGKGAM